MSITASSTTSQATAETGASAEAPATISFWMPASLFVLSGMTGLVDQLCFSKYLSTIVGSTAHAVSAVLAAFMTGLAVGAHIGGRLSTRIRRPLFAYGVLEVLVAVSVAVAPFAFQALTPLYVALARSSSSLAWISALRWLLAMLVVIVPTTAMGATLPLLSRVLGEGAATSTEEARRRERRLGILYAANTFGGALGALLAAYAVLPSLGLTKTLLAAALLSGLVGVAALVLGRRVTGLADDAAESQKGGERPSAPRADSELVKAAPAAREIVLLTVLAFLSGYLVFAAEVVFTHLLALIIGNSAYAFGLILASFLTCLFIGASRAPAFQRRHREAALPLSLALTGIAFALSLPLWDRLPLLFKVTGESVTSFAGREAVRGIACFAILALPASFMGLTFPLLLQRVARYANVGRLVGRLTAINTIGAVFGSLLTGYAFLPALGSQRVLSASAAIFALSGLLTAWLISPKLRRFTAIASAAAVGFALFAPRWDLARLTSGANVYFAADEPPDSIVMMEEDVHGGVTTVTKRSDVYTLYTNGKFQGNTGWEMKAQRFFAHYPSLFVTEYDKALVIGLGTGTTLGTVAAYPWRRIDVVEISPQIASAARRHFRSVNRGALDDPRVELHLGDGRNHLLLQKDRYRMIGIELTSVWFAGAASLYSREFYKLVHEHLEPGGIFQQWVQLHHITRRDFATVLQTLVHEFDHVALFYGGGQGILVASDRPLRASRAHVERLQQDPRVHETVPNNRELTSLLDDVLVTGNGLRRFLEDTARAERISISDLSSTDDNLYLEYATPRGNVLPWSTRDELVASLKQHHDPVEIAALLGD